MKCKQITKFKKICHENITYQNLCVTWMEWVEKNITALETQNIENKCIKLLIQKATQRIKKTKNEGLRKKIIKIKSRN